MKRIIISLVLLLGFTTIVIAGPPPIPPRKMATNAQITAGTSTKTTVSPAGLAFKLLSYMASGGNETQTWRFVENYLADHNCTLTSDGNWTCSGNIIATGLGTFGTLSAGAGGFTVGTAGAVTAPSVDITRFDYPQESCWCEATSDGDSCFCIKAPPKGTGFSANQRWLPPVDPPAANQSPYVSSVSGDNSTWSWQTNVGEATSNTFTNKTYDTSATGNVFKQTKYLYLTHPAWCDETGAKVQTTAANRGEYGQGLFADDANATSNYCVYKMTVPPDIDTSVDLTARWYYRLGAGDNNTQAYLVSLSSVEASESADGSFGNDITLSCGSVTSGADNDLAIYPTTGSAAATLTDWKSNVTANQMMLIRVGR